jgi:Zn ribbon nucleic-acid-binding protein
MNHRRELLTYIRSLTSRECEEALDVLQRHLEGPRCPSCDCRDMDRLMWSEDEHVTCDACGFTWDPNRGGPLGER